MVVADGQAWRVPLDFTTPIPGLMDWIVVSVVVQTSVVHSRRRMFSTVAVMEPVGAGEGRRKVAVAAGGGLSEPPAPAAVRV